MHRLISLSLFVVFSLAVVGILAGCERLSEMTEEAVSSAPVSFTNGTWRYSEFVGGYAWITFAPEPEGRTGIFTEKRYHCPSESNCTTNGTFEATPTSITLNSPRWQGKAFGVRVAQDVRNDRDVMEWTLNEVIVARLKREPPPPRPFKIPEWPPPSTVPPSDLPCDDMNAPQCLLSTRCVLEPVKGGPHPYRCRDASGPCEGGVAQFDPNFQANCIARPGCRFQPPRCFCPTARTRVPGPPPRFTCSCSGGPPAMCIQTL